MIQDSYKTFGTHFAPLGNTFPESCKECTKLSIYVSTLKYVTQSGKLLIETVPTLVLYFNFCYK